MKFGIRWQAGLWIALFGLFCGVAQGARLMDVRHGQQMGYYRFVLDFTAGVPRYQMGTAESGLAISLELPDTQIVAPQVLPIRNAESPIREVAVENAGRSTTRVIFRLRQNSTVEPRPFLLKDPDRLVLDFYPTPGRSAVAAPRQRNFKTVIIDPGHGGWDTGAVGIGADSRHIEKDIALDISKRLAAYFQASDSFQAYLTRTGDYLPFVDAPAPDPKDHELRLKLRRQSLEGRVKFANQTFRDENGQEYTADLFISVHVNTFPKDRRVRGFEVLIPGDKVTKDEIDRHLLAAENGEMLLETVPMNDSTKASAKAILSMVSERIMHELNPILAHHIERQIRRVDGRLQSRGVKQMNLRVLRNLFMPSVMVEVGFISNPNEVREYLSQDWFRQKMAHSIYTAVNEYFREIEGFQPDPVPEPAKPMEPTFVVHRVRKGENLSRIAQQYGINYQQIKTYNRMKSDVVIPGQELKIPRFPS